MANLTYKKIPNLLLKHRKINGLTQKQVAKVLGINPSRVSDWESGKGMPNTIFVFKLAILYRTMVDALFMDLIHYLRNEMKVRINKVTSLKKL